MSTAHRKICSFTLPAFLMLWVASAGAEELPTIAGPAMGTTYRVTLGEDVPGMALGEVHREVERVLARLDRALSTWRPDSDASRFNRAPSGEWLDVSPDLVAVVAIARRVHDDTDGAFDITVARGGAERSASMQCLNVRQSPPALWKSSAGIALDLGGIGPGYAVDSIGERLVALGSAAHLVELGGEVRAWGTRGFDAPWRVALRGTGEVIELAAGEALATSTFRPGRSPVDPRTGRVVQPRTPAATVRGTTCAEADARAVAALILAATDSPAAAHP